MKIPHRLRLPLKGEASKLAGMAWQVWTRYYAENVPDWVVRDYLDDLRQEVALIALEGVAQGLKDREFLRYANSRLYKFLKSLGLRKPKGCRYFVRKYDWEGYRYENIAQGNYIRV